MTRVPAPIPAESMPVPSTSSKKKRTSAGATTSRKTATSDTTKQRKRATQEEDENQENGQDHVATYLRLRSEKKEARRKLTIWRAPHLILWHFGSYLLELLGSASTYIFRHPRIGISLGISSLLISSIVLIPGDHQEYVTYYRSLLWFFIFWVGLGILSSVGLGTGLHTFVLYLGPYIAKTTLAATECGSLDFDTEGPKAFTCPNTPTNDVTFLGILMKIQMAAFLWGAGTAIGELPPYFVSRQAALSGQKLAELDELDAIPSEPTLMDKIKLQLFHALQRYGFWAIVVCASVPNPLFDLAGLTCGHFLIPFWTFFGATFIGKAVFKVHIQSLLVILAFSRERLESIINTVESVIPYLTGKLHPFFEKQKQQFHKHTDEQTPQSSSWLAEAWNYILLIMILFFVKSIIESTVQDRVATRDSDELEKYKNQWGITEQQIKDEKQQQTSGDKDQD